MENNESTQNKYDAALAKYNTNLNDAEVAAEVAKIIEEKVPANNTPEVKKFLFNCIDLTTLNPSYVASINFGRICECILRYAQLKPSITYSITKFFC